MNYLSISAFRWSHPIHNMLYTQHGPGPVLDETQYPQVIQDLFKILRPLGGLDAVEQAVRNAKEQDPETLERFGIRHAQDFINWITSFLTWVPFENDEARVVYDMVCLFAFVFDREPLISEQTPIAPASEDKPLTALSRWLVKYAKTMGAFMSTPASLTRETFTTFKNCHHYRVFECASPDGEAFRTFNEFFGRKLLVPRQIDGPGDNRIVTYAADSAFDNAFDIKPDSTIEVPADRWEDDGNPITAKSLTWSIQSLLDHSRIYESAFAGGVWMHSFLNTFNYHRFHAPVSGTIVEARVIQQASYLDAVAEDGKLLHRRRVRVPKDKEATNDMSGFQFLQTRGLIIIDTSTSEDGDIGLVAGTFHKPHNHTL